MEMCKNCMYHRYVGLGTNRRKEYIAFPCNQELEYKDEKCLKHGFLQAECKDFAEWEEKPKKTKNKANEKRGGKPAEKNKKKETKEKGKDTKKYYRKKTYGKSKQNTK